MAVAGLYRRILPSPPAVEFSSSEGKQLFSEALQSGTMEGFFKLISYFKTQSEPAFCGLASLSVVLNALGIDPGRKWKGPWRWFDESMLDCCEPLEKVKLEGITLGKVSCLARCAGAHVQAFRTDHVGADLHAFREHVAKCVATEDFHMIASYHRRPLLQTGTGHFSPIGGYHPGKDMVLILDVARFKYPPHWVPLPILWEAMNTIDEATGHHRGFMVISRLQQAPSLLYTLSCKHESWAGIASYLFNEVPCLLNAEGIGTVQQLLVVILASLPSNTKLFIKWVAEVRRQEEGEEKLTKEEKGRLAAKETVLQQIQDTELYKYITESLASSSRCREACLSSSGSKDTLPEIAASVCCQGAKILSGCPEVSNGFCCKHARVKSLKSEGRGHGTIVSSVVASGHTEHGVDMLVPGSQNQTRATSSANGENDCIYPACCHVLTTLLLALPPQTWSAIKDEVLRDRILSITSAENLPMILQEEVLHLRRQLHLLRRSGDKKLDDDLSEPPCT